MDTLSIKKYRTFKVKVDDNDIPYGRYNGVFPLQAANKALSEIIKNKKKNNDFDLKGGDINFSLIECTKGSNKKTYQYSGNRIKLENPVEYVVNGNTITKNYKNIIRKIKSNKSE
jgi:hypothetical protein